MTGPTRRGRRPYLRADDRRAQLLTAAGALAGVGGLGALTMGGVAARASVSRQWVHGHFGDLDGLCRALLLDRLAAWEADVDDHLAAAGATAAGERAVLVGRRVLELPAADRRVLRSLLDGPDTSWSASPGVGAELRERVLGRWLPSIPWAITDGAGARAMVWALVHATFGLADQVDRDEIGQEGALAVLGSLIAAALAERPMPPAPEGSP